MTEKNSRYIDPLTAYNHFTSFRGKRSDEKPLELCKSTLKHAQTRGLSYRRDDVKTGDHG